MHMADALISPAVGGTMWLVSGSLLVHSARSLRRDTRDDLTPLMGVLGAFVFAAQMINFTIPGTGSSGHIGGGLLLSILLGPHAAFLTIASVLTVQALFFADGGLLALGCNIFNLGFFPAFLAYPFVYRRIAGPGAAPRARIFRASVIAASAGLLPGAAAVVLQTSLSGISELPVPTFLALMLPIHLAIGIIEGLATAAVVLFVSAARPEMVPSPEASFKPLALGLLAGALLLGGIGSWFASAHPDGLEWAIERVAGELGGSRSGWHAGLSEIQETTAVMPDYSFRHGRAATGEGDAGEPMWPAVDAGTSAAGVIGGAVVLLVAVFAGFASRIGSARKTA